MSMRESTMAETKAQREAREAAAAEQITPPAEQPQIDPAVAQSIEPNEPGDDLPGADGTGAQNDDPTTRNGDAGLAEPTTPPETTNTAATLATATLTSEKVAPRQYREGERAERTLYGVVQTDGSVKATADGGTAEPEPGERATIIVAQGDLLTADRLRQLGV